MTGATARVMDLDWRVTESELELIVHAARWAPTAHNMHRTLGSSSSTIELGRAVGRLPEEFVGRNRFA